MHADAARINGKRNSSYAGAASEPRITLFCIPHAGGGASAYRNWASALGPQIAVRVLQLPGRESRFREPVLTELDTVLADLFRAVAPDTARPFALLGHSMGALLAFELSQMLRNDIGRAPAHLFVSACRAPHCPQIAEPCSTLPQPEFVAPAKPAAEKPEAAPPKPAPHDPLHALKAMSENEKIALFS